MSQRNSGYNRKESDFYPTPAWVTYALIKHSLGEDMHDMYRIWEPACGDDAMVDEFKSWGFKCWGTDIRGVPSADFLADAARAPARKINMIATNPPYQKDLVEAFIRKALALMKPVNGRVSMLLRVDFDSAKTRADIFADHPAWCEKLVLTKRIMWFEPPPGAKRHGPSENHAWFTWDWRYKEHGARIIYGQ